jgi:hypothetical protein
VTARRPTPFPNSQLLDNAPPLISAKFLDAMGGLLQGQKPAFKGVFPAVNPGFDIRNGQL